ncbi:MAG TPA: hypothetical protein VF079_06425 [Sphingomicrobium sp.]
MKLAIILLIGAVIGAIDGGGIFFAPGEPYPLEIFAAAILKSMLVAVTIGLTLRDRRSVARGAGFGLLYGTAFALVVFLAKGGVRSMDAPYVVPSGALFGAIAGMLVARLGFARPA